MAEWLSGCMAEGLSCWVAEWLSGAEWLNGWVAGWLSDWVTECLRRVKIVVGSTRLRWRNGWSTRWDSLGWWARQGRWARWSGQARWNWICKSWWRWWRRCRWKAWIGPCARQDRGILACGLIRKISSRLLHVKLRSKLRSWHLLWVPDNRLHRSAPAREER